MKLKTMTLNVIPFQIQLLEWKSTQSQDEFNQIFLNGVSLKSISGLYPGRKSMGSPLTSVHEVKLCRRQLLLQLQLMALRCLVRKSAIRALKVVRIAHTFTLSMLCYWRNTKTSSRIDQVLIPKQSCSRKTTLPLSMYGMMYSHDKMMMNTKPLGPTISGTNCFSGRYSPTYRVPDQMRDPMRRCMTNPPVSHCFN